MKVAIGIVVAAAVLFGAVLLFRPAPGPPAPLAAKPSPVTPAEMPPKPIESEVPKSPPTPAKKAVDVRQLLANLSRSLRNGDDRAVREILDMLRDLLVPPVPDDRNAALLYQQACNLMDEFIPKGDERKAFDALLMGKEPSAEELRVLRDWLGKNSDALAKVTRLLREAGDRLECRFSQEDSEWGLGVNTKTLLRMQRASNLLSVQAALSRLDGNPGEAAESLRAGLAMARATHSDPTLISQMIACALDGVAFSSAQREGLLGVSRLASLVDTLDPASVRSACSRGLLGDGYVIVNRFLKWRADPQSVTEDERRTWLERPLPAEDVAAYVDGVSESAGLFERPYGEVQPDLEALVRKYGEEAPWYASLLKMDSMPGTMRAVAASEARLSLVKVASELERYRAREGTYPTTLDALRVASLRDPFTGQPFAYRREGVGFVLEIAGQVPNSQGLVWRSRD